jgi:hypothetical protein
MSEQPCPNDDAKNTSDGHISLINTQAMMAPRQLPRYGSTCKISLRSHDAGCHHISTSTSTKRAEI